MNDLSVVLQKDLTIYRMKVSTNPEFPSFEYQLFKNGHFSKRYGSDTEYQHGIVSIHPIDGSINLKMADVKTCSFTELEDDNV